jgi:hypothetical protein
MLFPITVNASVLNDPSCTVKIEIMKISDKDDDRDVNVFFKVVDLGIISLFGCSFLHEGDIFSSDWDNKMVKLDVGMQLKSGVASGSSMGENGAIRWIHWSPLNILNQKEIDPIYYFSSSFTPTKLD